MPERRSWCMRRKVSALLAFVVMFIYVFNHTSISLFFAASSVETAALSDVVKDDDAWAGSSGTYASARGESHGDSHGTASDSNAQTASSSDAQRKIDQIIRLIDELPEGEEVEKTFAGLEAAGDEEAYEDYYAKLYEQVMEVYRQYVALTETEKESVYNREKLLAFEWLWSAAALDAGDEMTWEWLQSEIMSGGIKTITLTKNIEKPEDVGLPIVVPEGAEITLDLNGFTLTCDDSKYVPSNPGDRRNVFEVCGNGKLILRRYALLIIY